MNNIDVDTGDLTIKKKNRTVIYLIGLGLLAFLIWAANAPLREVVRGQGRVVPTTKTQVVQNLEGGIVRAVFVVEGEIVEAGQRVAKIDDTQFLSSYQELQEQKLAMMLKLERLVAEQDPAKGFQPNAELSKQAPEYAASEVELFRARKKDLSSTLEILEAEAQLKTREVNILKPMVLRKAVSEMELIKAQQVAIEAQGRVMSAESKFEIERSQKYSETLIRLRQIDQKIEARKDQLKRTDVVSPVRGIVNKVAVTTLGGVVKAGDPLVEIIPLDEELRIEGRIDPKDISFVYVSMPASVKFTAFDYSVYGSLKGTVVHVGADTVEDKTRANIPPYYEVFVKVDKTTMESKSHSAEIRPGMQAELELESGEKTVLEYLLKPIFKTTNAFTEK